MGYKLLTQIILIVTSLVIIFTFIKPTVSDFGSLQTEIEKFRKTVDNASKLNDQLKKLVQIENSFSKSEREKLETYLPSKLDHIQVMRDIQNIFNEKNQPLITLFSDAEGRLSNKLLLEGEKQSATDAPALVYRDFNISFVSSYEQLKSILAVIEANAYPLEVVSLAFDTSLLSSDKLSTIPSDQMKYTLVLRTFALSASK